MPTDEESKGFENANANSGLARGQCGVSLNDAYEVPRRAWSTSDAPPPAGSYNQAVSVGEMLFISGQTARYPDGTRCVDEPFDVQVRIALKNVDSIAKTAGVRLSAAAIVTVFLTDPKIQAAEFDLVYREFLDSSIPYPARAIVQSALPNGDIEVTAIIPH